MGRTVRSILRLEVPIIVRVGETPMNVSEAAALAPGAIIELPKRADEQLDLLVNNVAIAQGAAVKVGENFGIGIEYVGDIRERIEALGGQLTTTQHSEDDADLSDDDAAALADQFLNG
ncbi:MAG: FliM/FliN family flagellar motor switch protein [Planctomycetota bacterium]